MGEAAVARVLVVDDEPSALRFAVRALSDAGFDCDSASGVTEAQQSLSRSEYDLLLTDLNLSDGSGTALLRWVAARHFVLPVVLMTGYPTIASAVEALRLDAVDYLIKPCEDLGGAVSAAMARASQRHADRHALRNWASSLRQLADRLDRSAGKPTDASGGNEPTAHPLWGTLSARESDVAGRLVDGETVRTIAQDLGISENTVRNHLKSTYRKFGVNSQLELMRRLLGD